MLRWWLYFFSMLISALISSSSSSVTSITLMAASWPVFTWRPWERDGERELERGVFINRTWIVCLLLIEGESQGYQTVTPSWTANSGSLAPLDFYYPTNQHPLTHPSIQLLSQSIHRSIYKYTEILTSLKVCWSHYLTVDLTAGLFVRPWCANPVQAYKKLFLPLPDEGACFILKAAFFSYTDVTECPHIFTTESFQHRMSDLLSNQQSRCFLCVTPFLPRPAHTRVKKHHPILSLFSPCTPVRRYRCPRPPPARRFPLDPGTQTETKCY